MPISTFAGLQTSLRALLAQQNGLDVTNHNIANANTQGYSRQDILLSPSMSLTLPPGYTQTGHPAQLGTGVGVDGFRRVRDVFLDLQYRSQATELAGHQTTTRSLDQIELALAEPGANGIGAQLGKLWSTWSDVANAPERSAARQALVDQSKVVADSFANLDRQLANAATAANAEYAAIVGPAGAVADIARELGTLNQTIGRMTAMGDVPNDLLDRRDLLVDQLSELGSVTVQDLGDGTISVQFGDAAAPLVNGSTVTWPQTLTNPGGKLGALAALGGPGGTIAGFRADLNAVARTLADAINTLHNPGGTGTDFFTYTAGAEAGSLTVNVTEGSLRTSTGGASGDNDIALAIAGLRGGAADNAYSALVSRIGSASKEAIRLESNATSLVAAIENRRQSVSGVSPDEELVNMVRFQRGYQAASRMLSTIDEMLDVLINRTGRVGL